MSFGQTIGLQNLSWAARSLVTASILVIPVAVSYLRKRRARIASEAQFCAEKKCEPPATLQFKWPLALDLIIEAFSADKAGRLPKFFVSMMERTGNTFEQVLLGARGIDTQDPQNIEAVLSSQFQEFSLGGRSDCFRPLLGYGIFTTDGSQWKASRDLLRPQFKHIGQDALPEVQEVVEDFVGNIQTLAKAGVVDMQPLFFRLTLDTTMAVLFGRSLDDGTRKRDAEAAVFAKAFDDAQHMLARRGRLGDLYWLLDSFAFRRSCATVHRFVDDIVADALAEKPGPEKAEKAGGRYVFLKTLIARTRDPIALRDQCINVLLAGRDTTACLLSWTMFFLSRNPDVQQRLREECFGLASRADGDLPTANELDRMPLLRNTLKEVLRLYPSVPVNSRTPLCNTTLPTGGGPQASAPIYVRANEAVGYSVFTMHRRRDLYGEDAHAFRPDRWADDKLKGIGWGYLPFNGGPRICPGQEFALLQSSYTIVRLLQTFRKIQWAGPPGEERQTITLVIANADGCKVRLSTAE